MRALAFPEEKCYLETSAEMVEFYRQMKADRPGDERLTKRLGINYDTCHLAVEYEEAAEALGALVQEGIRISKLHFSSAMKVHPTPEVLAGLEAYAEDIYFHQVIARTEDGSLRR